MKTTLDSGAHIPVRKHTFDGGADLFARDCKVIPPHGMAVFDTGVHVTIPESCVGIVKGRSGLAFIMGSSPTKGLSIMAIPDRLRCCCST